MRDGGRKLALLCILAVASPFAPAQKPQIKVQVNLVSLEVEVLDREGKAILDLGQKDLVVKENGRAVEIAHFARLSDSSVSLIVVLETSFMPQARLSVAKQAIFQLVHLLKPQDEICLYTFDQQDAYLEQAFTQDRSKLVDALDNIGVPSGGRKRTLFGNLFGRPAQIGLGVDLGLMAAKKARHAKKALVVVNDRVQSLGPGTIEHAQEGGCSLLMLGFPEAGNNRLTLLGTQPADRLLIQKASEAGEPGDTSNVNEVCRWITYLLKSHYSLGFYTQFPESPEGRRIDVMVPSRDCRIYARRTYIPSR